MVILSLLKCIGELLFKNLCRYAVDFAKPF